MTARVAPTAARVLSDQERAALWDRHLAERSAETAELRRRLRRERAKVALWRAKYGALEDQLRALSGGRRRGA